MTPNDFKSAIRQAFESVFGPRPEDYIVPKYDDCPLPTINANAIRQREWDTAYEKFKASLSALEQHGYKVVPMEPIKEMLQAGLIFEGEYRSAIAASPELPT